MVLKGFPALALLPRSSFPLLILVSHVISCLVCPVILGYDFILKSRKLKTDH